MRYFTIEKLAGAYEYVNRGQDSLRLLFTVIFKGDRYGLCEYR